MGGILSDMETTMQSGDVEVLRKQIYDIFRQKDEELQRFKNDVIKHERHLSVNLNELTKDIKILHNTNVAQFDLLSKAGEVFGEVIRGTLEYKASQNKHNNNDDMCVVAVDKNTLLHMQALFNEINYMIGCYAPLGSQAMKDRTRMPYQPDNALIDRQF